MASLRTPPASVRARVELVWQATRTGWPELEEEDEDEDAGGAVEEELGFEVVAMVDGALDVPLTAGVVVAGAAEVATGCPSLFWDTAGAVVACTWPSGIWLTAGA
jgi:hypothetical protein